MAIRIVTDSASDLPPEIAQRYDVTVIPCYVIIGDETFRDGISLSADSFYERLGTLARPPTTAQPTPGDFEAVYRGLLEQGHQVVSIHVSSKLSGTVNSANQAVQALGDGAQVEVIDSALASLPMTLGVLEAAQAAEESDDYRSLAQQVRESLPRYHAFFMLDTLDYLQKGRPHRQSPGVRRVYAQRETHPAHPGWRGPPVGAAPQPAAGHAPLGGNGP